MAEIETSDSTVTGATTVDIARAFRDLVNDLPVKSELEWMAQQAGAVAGTAASAFPGRNSLTTGTAAEGLALTVLSGIRLDLDNTIADITKRLDYVSRSNADLLIAAPGEDMLTMRKLEVEGAEPVRLQLKGDAAYDAQLYRGYIGEIEKTLSKTFNTDFATSDDAKASAWRDLRQELWQETSEATLNRRYAAGASPATLRDELSPDVLNGRLSSALLDETGLMQRKALLADQSMSALTALRLLATTRDGLGIIRNVDVLNDPKASDAAKARAIADISRQGGTVLQVAGTLAIDALHSVGQGQSALAPLKANLTALAGRHAAGADLGVLRATPPSAVMAEGLLGHQLAGLSAVNGAAEAAQVRTRGALAASLGKAGFSLVAGLTGMSSDVTRIVTGSDPILIAQSGMSLATTATQTTSDLIAALATTTKTAQFATKLGIAGSVLGVVTGAVGLVGAIRDLQNNPTSGAAKWAVANSAVQVGAAVFAGVAAVVCPPAALLTLLLPDFGAIGRAIDLQSLKDDFWEQGLHHEWEVLKALHTVAALDAAPVVNWFNGVYASKIQNDMRSSMDTEWYWGAFDERAAAATREGTAYDAALKTMRAETGAAELFDIRYNRENFNWLGQDRSLFGTAVAVFDQDGHVAARDKTGRGAAVAIESGPALKDGILDHTVLLHSNFDPAAARPADQAIQGEWKTRQVWKWTNDFLFIGSEKWVDERYEDITRAAVAAGPEATLDLQGDNLVVMQAASSRVTSIGDSDDIYQVTSGTDYAIDDRAGDRDEVRFAASGDGQRFVLQGQGIEVYTGSSHDDIVIGGTGDDIYRSGGGNDDISLDAGDDLAVAGGSSRIDLGDGDNQAILTDIGPTVIGGAGHNVVNLADSVGEAVSLTAPAATGDMTISASDPTPGVDGPVSRLSSVGAVQLTPFGDRANLATDATGDAPVTLALAVLDTGAGDDEITSFASGVAIAAGAGNDRVVIGSDDGGHPPVRDVVVVAGPGDDSVTVAGEASLRVELNDGDDRVSASRQTAGFLEIAALTGGGRKSVDLGTADTIFRFGAADQGTVDVIDGHDRAAAGHGLAFDFASESADRLIFTVSSDESAALTCNIATVGSKLNIALHSANTDNSFICVGNEAYAIDAAVGLLSQEMASLGQRSATVQLSALPQEMHMPLNLAVNPTA